MKPKTFLILGGYGNTGRCLARLLLQETEVRLVLAGRSLEKAEELAAQLNSAFAGNRVAASRADAGDRESLTKACAGADLMLVASSTAGYAQEVATAALSAGIDYLDIIYSQRKVQALQSLAGEMEKAGLCFITEAGFHPGLPAALVRYVSPYFDRLERAVVSSLIHQVMPRSESLYELVEEFKDYQAFIFQEGRWQKASMTGMIDAREINFGPEFGYRYCFPMTLAEMRPLPEMFPSLKETGFYITGFNWFTDWLVFPVMMLALRLWPRRAVKPMGNLLHWGIKTFSAPPYGTVLKVEAGGVKDGKAVKMEVLLFHEDAHMFTAIPVTACLRQYLDGSIKKPGLHMMGLLTDPQRLLQDMERMGIKVAVSGGGL